MTRELPEAFQPGTNVHVIHKYGPITPATITKRTATQITTTDVNGKVERWICSWASGDDHLQPYGSAEFGCIVSAQLTPSTSQCLADERLRRRESRRQARLNAALDTARRHRRIEDMEALLALLPEWIENEKSKAAAAAQA